MCRGKYNIINWGQWKLTYHTNQNNYKNKCMQDKLFIRFWNIFCCWMEQLLSDIKLHYPWLNTCTMSMYKWSYTNILIKHINIISRRVPLVEQELFTFSRKHEHIHMPWARSGYDNTNSWPWVRIFCISTKSLQDRELKQAVRTFCISTKSFQDRKWKQAMTTRTPAKTGSENR